jgi:hypothetical protein
MSIEVIKLGVVWVDSGQLMICDPSYIEDEFKISEPDPSSSHEIYKHLPDGKLWQFCYFGKKTPRAWATPFPGGYSDIIPEYNTSPETLIEQWIFEETDLAEKDISEAWFSYERICQLTTWENKGWQLFYKLGHAWVAVAFQAGFGDWEYEVFAELIETKSSGKRVKKIWIELITDDQMEEIETAFSV